MKFTRAKLTPLQSNLHACPVVSVLNAEVDTDCTTVIENPTHHSRVRAAEGAQRISALELEVSWVGMLGEISPRVYELRSLAWYVSDGYNQKDRRHMYGT
jgi:hypothetical protein